MNGILDACVLYSPVRDRTGAIVDLRYADVNTAAEHYLGQRHDDIVGKRLLEVYPAQAKSEMLPRLAHVIDTGEEMLVTAPLHPNARLSSPERIYDIRGVRVDGELVSVTWRDVTVRVRALQSLAESEARYRLLAEHATDVVIEADADGAITWVSPAVTSVLGWAPEDLIGHSGFDFVAHADLVRAREALAGLKAGDSPHVVEIRFRATNGDERWLASRTQIMRDTEGRMLGSVTGLRECHREVVARRAATTLSAANAILVRAGDESELLAEMCDTAVAQGGYMLSWYGRLDARGDVTFVARSTNAGDLLETISARWGDAALNTGPTTAALRTGRTQNFADLSTSPEYAAFAKVLHDLGLRSAICIPVVVNGAIDGALAVYAAEHDAFDDLSTHVLEDLGGQIGTGLSRLRAAQRMEALINTQALFITAIDQSAEAVILTDPRGSILYANPSAIACTGYSLDELLGQNPRMLQSGLHEAAFYETMWARLTGGQSFHGVMINRRKNGQIYEEEATITPVHDEGGNLLAYVGVHHDLTSQRELEASVSRDQHDRTKVLDIMRHVRPADTVEATAAALCRAVADMDDFDAAIVLFTRPDGAIVPIGMVPELQIADEVDEGLPRLGKPIPVENSDALVAATKAGPWWIALADPDGPAVMFPELRTAMLAEGYSITAYAPIRWEGEVVGALGIASKSPTAPEWITSRLGVIEELGSFAGMLFGARAAFYGRQERMRSEIRTIIDDTRFHPVFQPVVDLASGMTIGYEALTRFDDGMRPDLRFADAHSVGLGSELECACAGAALRAAATLPASVWLSVNFSPSAVIDGTAAATIAGAARPIVIEITEHIEIESYPAVRRAIEACAPARLAVDDAGAGFASLRHILELQPHIVKLDIGLVRGIDTDPAKQALAAGLCHFSVRTNSLLIAEGIERSAELATLRDLGVDFGQGYLLGAPQPIRFATGEVLDLHV